MKDSITAISMEQAIALADQHYGITAQAKQLPGEEDFNFYLKANDGKEYTLKLSRPGVEEQVVQFQTAIIRHLAEQHIPLAIPEIIPTVQGADYVVLEEQRLLRVQKWVPGRMLATINPRSPELLASWGKTAGLLSLHLQGFDHPAAHRFYKWNPSETLFSKKYHAYFQQNGEVAIADYFWDLFSREALPRLKELRKSINYNDAHEHNLLCDSELKHPRVNGVIDFGDALYTETINELAIACAYAGMMMPDPLEAVTQVVKAYHEVFPLEEKELEVLFPLIGARLMITVASAAWNKQQEPDNEYLVISEKPAWDVLRKWREVPPAFAHYRFRQVCGLEPCPAEPLYQNWLKDHAQQITSVIDFADKTVIPLDLKVSSTDLGNNSNFNSIRAFEKTINRLLEEQDADMGIGGYTEVRPFYTTDAYLVEGNSGAQWRTVHMGMDVWAKAETPVYAPLDGIVQSFQDNAAERDYGPTIILQHQLGEGHHFYTLYGHLSADSLDQLEVGQVVRQGEQIAKVGPPPVNGNWPPHLHFQVMLDLLGKQGDFPGVVFPEELPTWKSICPDPAPFFKTAIKPANDSYTTGQLLQIRKNKLGKSLSISYDKPLRIVRGFMQYLYDDKARRYLDTVNNVPHVGHQHPGVVKAAQDQIGLLNTNTRYLHQNIVQFAEELLATFPPELSVVHFVNSGSEANELALRMVRAYTGQKDMVAVEVGYHGNTGGCIDISSYKFDGKGGKGAPPFTHIVPIPDTYRGLYRNDPEASTQYANHIKKAVANIQAQGRNVGGFICESILSCGGQIVLPEGYLAAAYQHVRAAGGLCIADEVQVGFGRVGDTFWGFELQDVVPDIVTLGKPIGNGHPLAAVVTTAEVAEAFANGMEYFNTFGGNPVSCAIGREVLKVVQEEQLQNHAREMGAYLMDGLRDLQQRFPIIGDVRGHGLFLGFELVKHRETLEPAAAAAAYLANRMQQRGVLMSTDGPLYNVMKIKPPMCFDRSHADFFLENIAQVMQEDFMREACDQHQ